MIKIFEGFAGYGGGSFALKKLGIDFDCVGYSEIDKFAIQCYEQNHYETCDCVDKCKISPKNFGDITKINPHELPDFDLFLGGFPCQSFSVAGLQKGELDTRGTLFYDIIRICEVKKPKYILLENVKGLTFKNHKETFEKILRELRRIGYYVQWSILNTKEYGIPQNRERVFFVCFRDICEDRDFDWPEKQELKLFLKDILEEEVDEKYYLSEKQIMRLKKYLSKKKNKINEEVMNCIGTCFGRSGSSSEECESYARTNKALMLGNLKRYKTANRRIDYKEDGVSWCLTGSNDVGILDIYNNKLKKEVCPTLTEPHHNNLRLLEPNAQAIDLVMNKFSIRKLTPTECFRLMGFLDDEINLDGLSNSQKYKLAGNGWDINLVSKILKEMIKPSIVQNNTNNYTRNN